MSNILLTATTVEPTTIVSYIVGIIIIGLMGYFIYTRYKKDPNGEAKLKEFLDNIQDIVKEHIVDAINTFDFQNAKDSFAQVQAEFIEDVYDDIWDLCSDEVEKLADTDTVLYALLKKTITKSKIEEYVMTIFSEESIQDKLAEVYNIALKDKMTEAAEEDKKLEEEAEAYENGDVEAEPVPELDPTKIPERENDPIVPPVDEESETVSADDPAIEVVPQTEIDLNSEPAEDEA